ncbi:MAG: beta-propeller fold lactonase family protein [Bacteroidales bacterium]|nr:beta-propeller fold lactonase family protein [Bacteroidales bacterium]
MKIAKKIPVFIFCTLLAYSINLKAGWEMISPNPKMLNIQVMGDTWFGIEYHGTGTGSLFLSSKNNGHSWDTIPDFTTVSNIRIHNDRILVRGIYNGFLGFYLSSDSAKTWQKLFWPYDVGENDMFLNDSSIIIFVNQSSSMESPLYRSLDTGKTWHPLPIDVSGIENWNGNIKAINLKLYGETIGAFLNAAGFHISDDGGTTWTKKMEGLPAADIAYGPLSVLPDGFSVRYNGKWYKFNGESWVEQVYQGFIFDVEYEKWVEKTPGYGLLIPYITAVREPYMFAINGDAGQYIHYSIDGGKKWFQLSEYGTDFLSAFATSIVISGNYVYAGFDKGFARRSLSEVVNHVIKPEEEEKKDFPLSPAELDNLMGALGPGAFQDLLDAMGVDAEELSKEELADFLEDYADETGMSPDPFVNSQPGTCSYMGMPLWSMNVANLKLFVRDMIFRKKGIGPEMKFALNYTHTADSAAGIFGRHWRFEYEDYLLQKDSLVVLSTGTGAFFTFSQNQPVVTGAASFTLPCINHDNIRLHWTGTQWQVEKGFGYEILSFIGAGDNRFVLSSVEDSYGKKISIGYDAQFKPEGMTDGSGRQYSLKYNGNLCDSLLLPDGRAAAFNYNSRDLLVSSVDLNGIETIYTYDGPGNIGAVDIAGKITRFVYNYSGDSLGAIASVTDPEGRISEYFITVADSATRITNVTYPGGKTTTYMTTNGLVTSITNAGGEAKKIFYNEAGKPDSLVWYDGSYTTFSYDADKNITSLRDRSGNVTSYGYNANRKLLNEINEKGDTTSLYSYNGKNQLLTAKYSDGNITAYAYDENGALASMTDIRGNTHEFGRDTYGNLVSYTNPLGHAMHYNYDAKGLMPAGITDFNGNEYTIAYDANGRIHEVVYPDGNKKTYHYDCCSQTGVTDENGNTFTVVRDFTNRVLEKISAEGYSYPVDFDETGFISGYTTPYGSTKKLTYNPRGLLTVISDEEGYIRYDYNEQGKILVVRDKLGNETRFSYDENGNLNAISDAEGKKTSFGHNDDGTLSTVTNARNQATTLEYNPDGKVTGKKAGDVAYASYDYDYTGALISYSDSSGTTVYTRNALGFVTKIVFPNEHTVEFEHDANGNLVKTTYPDGTVVTNTPDAMNRVVKVAWGDYSVDFEYDAAGNLLSETRSNTTKTLYSYNKDNQLLGVSHVASDTVFAGEIATYSNGIVTNIQLKLLPEITAIPPAIWNLSANSLNQVDRSFFSQLSFPHDADGNMTAFIDKGGYLMSAGYTHDNLLSKINTPDASVKISYDAMRYPRKMVENGVTSYLYYDHKGRLLFETDADGDVTVKYIYRGRRIVAAQRPEGTGFYQYSRNGHTLAVTGPAGEVLKAYAYSIHGFLIGKEGQFPNRLTFLGAFGALRLDDNYILTGARVYNVALGRYLQRDPLGIITGTNPYLYASNNPVAGNDPLGLSEQEGTVNAQGLDPSSDNDYGTAGGTANPFADDIPDQASEWEIAKTAISNTLNEFSEHPVADLLPDALGNPIAYYKAANHLSNKEYGKALWQFMPFNNSIDWAAGYLQEKTKYNDPSKFSGLGIFGDFNKQQTFSCEL